MCKRVLAMGMALVIALLAMGSSGWAAPQLQTRSVITYPESNTTVGGTVEIRGIATHPSSQWWYNVSYAPGPEPTGESQWVTLAQVDNTPVENDVLVVWDTTSVPDGVYTLALTIKGQDDPNYWQFFVTNLAVNNTDLVATPTPGAPTPEPMPTAVVGPTPTSVPIEQPATPTPRPSPTPRREVAEETAAPSTGEGEPFGVPLDVAELRTAFCTGGLITVVLLLLWGFYLVAKAGVRWFLRHQRTNRLPR